MNIRELHFEYQAGILLAAAALILSLLMGLAAGNSFGQAFVRSVGLAVFFAAVGFGAVIVIKNFVPEIYELISHGVSQGAGDAAGEMEMNTISKDWEETGGGMGDEKPSIGDSGVGTGANAEFAQAEKSALPDEFIPFKESDFSSYSSADPSGAKLGKHLFEEKKIKYEPKIMAEAIRTMMSKDKD